MELPEPKSAEDLALIKAHARAKAMADAVVQAFSGLLKDEARKAGGVLDMDALNALDSRFKAKAEELADVFTRTLQDSVREQQEIKWQQIKRPPFDRLMVKRFEHMLFHKDEHDNLKGELSRRMLPGFFLALSMMMGPEAIENYQTRLDAAIDRIMQGKMPVDWDKLDQDRETRDIMLDAQLAILRHFDDLEQRTRWFVNLVNSHLAPAGERASESEKAWALDPFTLHAMIKALLSDLEACLNNDGEWVRLKTRHPEIDAETIKIRIALLG